MRPKGNRKNRRNLIQALSRPQNTVEDLVHEMHCWVYGIQDHHDKCVTEYRSQVLSMVPESFSHKFLVSPDAGQLKELWGNP